MVRGPFAVYPFKRQLLEEDQSLAFDSFSPFPLRQGISGQHRSYLAQHGRISRCSRLLHLYLSDGLGNSLFRLSTPSTLRFYRSIDPFSVISMAIRISRTYTITGGLANISGHRRRYLSSQRRLFASALADHPGAIPAEPRIHGAQVRRLARTGSWIGMILGLSLGFPSQNGQPHADSLKRMVQLFPSSRTSAEYIAFGFDTH